MRAYPHLGLKLEVLRRGPEQHLAYLDPVCGVKAAHEAFQLVSPILEEKEIKPRKPILVNTTVRLGLAVRTTVLRCDKSGVHRCPSPAAHSNSGYALRRRFRPSRAYSGKVSARKYSMNIEQSHGGEKPTFAVSQQALTKSRCKVRYFSLLHQKRKPSVQRVVVIASAAPCGVKRNGDCRGRMDDRPAYRRLPDLVHHVNAGGGYVQRGCPVRKYVDIETP